MPTSVGMTARGRSGTPDDSRCSARRLGARVLLAAFLCLFLTRCGDLPTPFKGNPGATAQRLARPPPPLLAIGPFANADLPDAVAAGIIDNLAVALQMVDVPAQAKRPQPSEWQLLTRAVRRDGWVVPVFTVRDPAGADKGQIEGTPIAALVWQAGGPDLARMIASDAAPKVSALLTSIRIFQDKADPNSLYNRPAKVLVTEVTGAPGDGNQSLTRQVRAHLIEYGWLVQTTRQEPDFEVRGDVAVTPTPNGRQMVEIIWTVLAANGDERGKVAQLNEIQAGLLDRLWGDVAVAVGTEAAGGIDDVIRKQSGRANEPAKATPPAPAVEEPLPLPPVPPAKPPPRAKKPRGGADRR